MVSFSACSERCFFFLGGLSGAFDILVVRVARFMSWLSEWRCLFLGCLSGARGFLRREVDADRVLQNSRRRSRWARRRTTSYNLCSDRGGFHPLA